MGGLAGAVAGAGIDGCACVAQETQSRINSIAGGINRMGTGKKW
jgi:hypothetical protein